jgi:pimeloyl-[acyl-carrier protein] methyl ester esterase
MKLHRVTLGSGADVALLHGWGLHGGIFDALATSLRVRHRVHVLDLPGHGRSPWAKGAGDLEGMARGVAAHLPERCNLVGWSLGGLVAVRIATLFPARVPALALIATGAAGARRRDSDPGPDDEMLAAMAKRLGRDWRGTVQEFLGLEVRGDANPLEALRELKRCVQEGGAPSTAALEAGLAILRTADLRPELAAVRARTLIVAGEYDRLTPPAAAAVLAAGIAGARYVEVKRAAHAPFLSHRAEMATLLDAFLAEGA